MDYTHLGRSGLSVSRLCLGTMNFGPMTTEPDSHAIMDRALEHGINFFDTANTYGWRLGEDPANVALAWLLSRPGVTAPIIGPRTIEQLDGAQRAVEITLAKKTLTALDKLFPPIGSGGPAPEAFAW